MARSGSASLPAERATVPHRSNVSRLDQLVRSKLLIWTLIVLPGLWPAVPLFVEKNPAALTDPLKLILHHLGFMACLLLATVLTFSPLRVLFPRWGVAQGLNRHRRLVGVSAFAYGLVHYGVHLVYEGGLEFIDITLKADLSKPFLVTGMIALTILLALAVTSLNAAVRWLGGKRWKNLHRLAYVAAALVAYHQAAARKVFPMQVVWIFGPLVALEIARVIKQRKSSAGLSPAPASR
jgi:methionine sulfoxide reductase heme-binding subunit